MQDFLAHVCRDGCGSPCFSSSQQSPFRAAVSILLGGAVHMQVGEARLLLGNPTHSVRPLLLDVIGQTCGRGSEV